MTRCGFANERELLARGHVAHNGIAIHRRGGKGRLGALGRDILRQNAACGLSERDGLGRHGADQIKQRL